mmetsp:Transcript_44109/g.93902  ORF Transcript_44109/g.93902 Transcript_44109/m.93902 type:complete len:256 (-) Transcript_44109:168-935(-)
MSDLIFSTSVAWASLTSLVILFASAIRCLCPSSKTRFSSAEAEVRSSALSSSISREWDAVSRSVFSSRAWDAEASIAERTLVSSSLCDAANCSSCSDWELLAIASMSDFIFSTSAVLDSFSWLVIRSISDKRCCSASACTRFNSAADEDRSSSRNLLNSAECKDEISRFFSSKAFDAEDSMSALTFSISSLCDATNRSSCSFREESAIDMTSDWTCLICAACFSFNSAVNLSTSAMRRSSAAVWARSSSFAEVDA